MKDVVIDTNVFVRHFIGDIPLQFEEVEEFLVKVEKREATAFVSILVINELIWILEKYYKVERSKYMPELIKLLALRNFRCIEVKKGLILSVFESMQKKKIDFTDVYLFHIAKKRKIFSFDNDFEKLS